MDDTLTNPVLRENKRFANSANDGLNEVISLITIDPNIEAVYCYGKRMYNSSVDSIFNLQADFNDQYNHYDLMLVSSADIRGLTQLQEQINTNTRLKTTITLICNTINYMTNTTINDYSFFNRVIDIGELLYAKRPDFKIEFAVSFNSDILSKTLNRVWDKRRIRANGLMVCADTAWDYGDGDITLFLLAQSMEQICLGLISRVMGYSAQKYGLAYLFDLCNNFSSASRELFPLKTEEDRKIFRIIEQSLNAVEYHGTVGDDLAEIYIIIKRCKQFLHLAGQMGEIEQSRTAGINNDLASDSS